MKSEPLARVGVMTTTLAGNLVGGPSIRRHVCALRVARLAMFYDGIGAFVAVFSRLSTN